MGSCTRRYGEKMSKSSIEREKDVPDARKVFKAILEAIVVVVSWRRRQYRDSLRTAHYVSVPCFVFLFLPSSLFDFRCYPVLSCHNNADLCQGIGWEDCYF